MDAEIRAISVKQLNFYVKSIIENDKNLRSVTVKGEISGFVCHQRSGHAYFTLKDDSASVKTVMFASNLAKLSFLPENGMKVYVRGRVSLFERDGQFQLYAESMILQGIGESWLAFEALKEKLEKEGLFSSEFKKPLPRYPEKIGLITSPTGAAVQDFINITKKRFPCVEILLYPVNVQGEKTVGDVLRALSYFEENPADVIVITRGGGSYEDLAVFNSEDLARKIFSVKTPVVSAIGHEIDFTVIDFVADYRAPTPSAAAEAVTPDGENLGKFLSEKRKYIENSLKTRIESDKMRLSFLKEKTDISEKIKNESILLDGFYDRVFLSAKSRCEKEISRLSLFSEKINALNPLSVLSRGFSAAFKNGRALKSVKDIKIGEKFTVKITDGEIDCAAENIRYADDV